jgi:dTDP-4-amino-4,6-dideoxygalactose transaminase
VEEAENGGLAIGQGRHGGQRIHLGSGVVTGTGGPRSRTLPLLVSVPLFDLKTPLEPLREEVRARMNEVLDRGVYILGPEGREFEAAFASYLGVKSAIGVGNGTDAITLALRALDVKPGDDVVVPSFSFYASAEAIPHTGARPVFCDIDPDTFNVTPDTVKAALTPKTKAVIAVDLFGNPAPAKEIEALGVPVLSDSAQATGARRSGIPIGAQSTVTTFSFFPSKNLPGFGDGGAVTTDSDEVAERVRLLRHHGSKDKGTFSYVGYNSRLDELQAAGLRVLLPHLDAWAEGRRAAAAHYADAGLGDLVTLPTALDDAEPAWHLYVIRHPERDRLANALAAAGIGAKAYYAVPIHRQPGMRRWGEGVELPATDEVAATHLAIPMFPTLSAEQAGTVVDTIRAALA